MNDPIRFTVAVAQCASLVGQVEANLRTVSHLCAEAAASRADLVLFPECHATGYSYRDLASLVRKTEEPRDGSIGRRLRTLAAEHALVICCGMFERDGKDIYNTHLVAFPDGRREGQRKGALTSKESAVLHPEKKRIAFQWKDIRFSILVCADNALPDWRDQIRLLNLRLLLHPSAGSLAATDGPAEEALRREESPGLDRARQMARELKLTYAVSNPIGFSGEDYYPGNSWIINPRGETLVHFPATAQVERMKNAVASAPLN